MYNIKFINACLCFSVMKLQFPANFPCNEIMCPNYYFCSAVDLQCHHCNSYCKETKNNYDQEICARQCPGNYYHFYDLSNNINFKSEVRIHLLINII